MTENLENADDSKIRLQVALSRAGVASRRHAEEMISDGRVRVDGNIVREMGVKVNPDKQEILIDEKPLPKVAKKSRTVLLNKPVGYLSAASDGHGGRCVTELVASIPARLVPVGRLDKDSCGLLLLSDDGDLIAHITHPRYNHQKVYHVEVAGLCDEEVLGTLQAPMDIDGYLLRPVGVSVFERLANGHTVLRFVLHEGRNRQIRKMCAQVGLLVVSLMRVALDRLQLGDLKPGQWRDLTSEEVETLRKGALEPIPPKKEKIRRSSDWDDFSSRDEKHRDKPVRFPRHSDFRRGQDDRKPFEKKFRGDRGRSVGRDDYRGSRSFHSDDRHGFASRDDDRRAHSPSRFGEHRGGNREDRFNSRGRGFDEERREHRGFEVRGAERRERFSRSDEHRGYDHRPARRFPDEHRGFSSRRDDFRPAARFSDGHRASSSRGGVR